MNVVRFRDDRASFVGGATAKARSQSRDHGGLDLRIRISTEKLRVTARDAQNATKMIYVVRHVRMLQDLVEKQMISVFQVDGRLNPADALSKWLEACHRAHHMMFLMGDPRGAIKACQDTTMYRSFKPKRLVPAPTATGSP